MFGLSGTMRTDARSVLAALGQSLAIIEFDPTGRILDANSNFCDALGYDLSEIKGQHHSMFCEPAYAQSAEYKAFWAKLARGEYEAHEFKRVGKGGREVWIQASYNPITDSRGKVVKVVKQATDITVEKLKAIEMSAKMNAISRAQAVIEFTAGGEILTANDNFLKTLGYSLEEIRGQHHRMFVEPAYGQSPDYQDFWKRLNEGQFIAAEFKRVGKGGREVWIQASYNPIFDLNNKVTKIVKFATDVTERVQAVNDIETGLTELANNNLAHRIEQEFSPAFEKLRLNFNASVDKIQATLLRIADSTSTIKSGTQEIATAADNLSRRTEQQAANLEETAAALDEITATVRKTAEGATHARQVVATAKTDAEKSGTVVRKAVEAMKAIENSSRQIEQIIGVIDEIAFQTNLLALNAGVEAARAGDAGRGFAVVASEVRSLAQRSAEAAKEIKSLISTSGQQVTVGVGLVDDTGEALERIVTQVTEINDIVNDMTASASEQSTALQEVNTAVNNMDQMTQQNAAMVEESTAASTSLSQEATELAELVGDFKLGQDDAGAFSGRRAPAARTVEPLRKSAPARTAVMLKTTGRGGAARKPVADQDTWEEF